MPEEDGAGPGTADIRAGRHTDLIHPRQREVVDVPGVDLFERAVVAAGIVSVKRRPAIGLRMRDRIGRQFLAPCRHCQSRKGSQQGWEFRFHSGPHLSVAR